MKSDCIPLRTLAWLTCAASALLASSALAAPNPFAEMVRQTEPLAPAEQQQRFHLPPGFEIQLVAAEPDISKPMNLAFDAQGRLWITESQEYPFPAPAERKARDAIKVLEDFAPDGRARKVTTFAEGLNIPIGLYPWRGGVIALSIPHVYHFQDTDGDGRADKQDVLFGPYGREDTHGMTSAFRRGLDGWLYACHGFKNTTTLTGQDGGAITMNSGNTYRMRLDGSRVEQFTWGQVNPFGLAFDHLGNLYSADCHSHPIYQLLRGAYYPSFGKPHDGLGFGPAMMSHAHGSTAIGGIVYYADSQFPPEFRGNFFIGNVMTSRINRDSVIEHGSTWRAKEEPDFVRCDDPWFRPVDLQLGPDGALYVADFYNRIIGHYEVPLDHPGRDRERGRIWRIVYQRAAGISPAESDGLAGTMPAARLTTSIPNLATAKVPELIRALAHDNLTVRTLAAGELSDRIGKPAITPLKGALKQPVNAFQAAHALWVLFRLEALDEKILSANARHADPLVRVHVMRILSETAEWSKPLEPLAARGLADSSPHVQRAAADALGQHPAFDHVAPLLSLRSRVPAEDTHLLHVVRMALRNQVRPEPIFARVRAQSWSEADANSLADVALGVPSAESALFLLDHVQHAKPARATVTSLLRHIARHLPESGMDSLAGFVRREFANDLDFQLSLLKSIQEGSSQRGAALNAALRDWAGEVVAAALNASREPANGDWTHLPLDRSANLSNPWILQRRKSADGDGQSLFIGSLPPGGEQFVGRLRSRVFEIPAKLTFFLAGHDGFPKQPLRQRNFIRLRDAATQQVLAQSAPPRNDVAQRVEWDLREHAGKRGQLEIVDGNTERAYAWLAVGRFEPPVVALPESIPNSIAERQRHGAELARALKLNDAEPQLAALLAEPASHDEVRIATAKALAALSPRSELPAVAALLLDPQESVPLREQMAGVLAGLNSRPAREALVQALELAPGRLQTALALALAGSTPGAEALLETIEQGKASPRLLQESAVRERLKPVTQLAGRVENLTRELVPADVAKQKLLRERLEAFDPAKASPSKGAHVFAQNCAVCHQISGAGGLVGPQLDGIGHRGLERLLEDILDPNRNVDHAFRYSTLKLRDDEIMTGLFRREEGQLLIFADATGNEFSVAKTDVVARVESNLSLMPDNLAEIIPGGDLNDLLAYLLAQGKAAGTSP